MNIRTTERRPSLASLSDDEFKMLIRAGGTLTISQINDLLDGSTLKADTLSALNIESRRSRAAVHIAAHDFPQLCLRHAARILKAGRTYRKLGEAQHHMAHLPADDTEGGAL